ncbi:hypothetical protein HDU97_008038, partial [Phlyctochytrium planicorne]
MASAETLRSSPTPFDDDEDPIDSKDLKHSKDDLAGKAANELSSGKEVDEATAVAENKQTGHIDPGFLRSTNPFSLMTMSFLNGMMKLSLKRPLEFEDLPRLEKSDQTETIMESFQPYEAKIQEHLAKKKVDPTIRSDVKIFPALLKFGGMRLAAYLLVKLLCILSSLYIPFILKALIVYLQKKRFEEKVTEEDAGKEITSIFGVISDVVSREIGIWFQLSGATMLGTVLYKKALRLSHSSSRNYDDALIMSLINIESEEVVDACLEGLECILLPLHVILSILLLISLLGFSVYPSAIVIVGCFMLVALVSIELNKNVRKYQETDDSRASSIIEILTGMKSVKLESQENARAAKVRKAREVQMGIIRRTGLALSCLVILVTLPQTLMPIASFVTYALKNGEIDAAIVFPALMYFEPLLEPIQNLPNTVIGVFGGFHAFHKLKAFLLAEEHEDFQVDDTDDMDPELAIEIKDATLQWEARREVGHEKGKKADEEQNISSELASGYGKEKGKEKELKLAHWEGSKLDDDVGKGGVESHAKSNETSHSTPDEPFFQNLNLKIRKGKLTAIIGTVGSGKTSLIAACLGDMKLVSGSIKVRGRTALCEQRPWLQSRTVEENILFGNAKDESRLRKAVRCCGLDRDIEEQMEYGLQTQIGEKGITLSGGQKARIALARAVYDSEAEVYLLDDPLSALDARVSTLVFDQCILRALAGKTRVLITHQIHILPRVDHIVVVDGGKVVEEGTYQELMRTNLENPGVLKALLEKYTASQGVKISRRRPLPRRQDSVLLTKAVFDRSTVTTDSALLPSYEDVEEELEVEDVRRVFHQNHLIAAEERGARRANISFLWSVCKLAGGLPMVVTCILSVIIAAGSALMRELWLTWWTEERIGLSNHDYVVGAMSFATAYGGTTLCKNIHELALDGLLKAKLSFYDSQPLGRIFARMTKDFAEIDVQAWLSFVNLFLGIGMFISAAGAVIYSNYYSVPLLALLGAAQYYFVRMYRNTGRDIKRMGGHERSPISSHMSECLNGVTTLRAFKSLIFFFILFISLYGVLAPKFSPSIFGLAVQASDQLATFMFMIVRSLIVTELHLVAVERIHHYCFNLPQEAPFELPKDPSPDAWPKQGGIVMTNVSIKYESMDEP